MEYDLQVGEFALGATCAFLIYDMLMASSSTALVNIFFAAEAKLEGFLGASSGALAASVEALGRRGRGHLH